MGLSRDVGLCGPGEGGIAEGTGVGGPRAESERKDGLSGGAACAQTPGREEMRGAARAHRSARCFPPLFPVA